LPAQPLSSQTRHHIFLAVQEALTNILKHSGATHAKIAMTYREGSFEIIISDNGTGFDPLATESHSMASQTGFRNGLRNMRQRVTELNGRFSVESQPGRGTVICFMLSLNGPLQ
jgi:signal transduction histidine kinase